MVERIDIERGLDKLSSDAAGFTFQSLAVVLAKLRWPELIACERQNDRGLDAYAPVSVSTDGQGKGLACSTTGTFDKVKSDAAKVKKHYPDVSLLIFYTPQKISQSTKAEWAEKIQKDYGYELVVASREEIIASLQLPDNAQLCRVHLGIPVPYQPALSDLLRHAQEASAVVAAEWAAHPRLAGKPYIALNAVALTKNGDDTAEIANPRSLRTLLLQGRRMVLEGPAGRGKTTTLVQLAGAGRNGPGIPLLVDLPNWVRSGKDILEYVASSPAFRARGINAEGLARLPHEDPFLFLLNGWNEITEFYSSAAVDALRALERTFPKAGIIVATRTHHIVPPLPGASRFRLLPLTATQRHGYLMEALGQGAAQELNLAISGDRELDQLTRTPFVLSEVTALFRAGLPIPRTKLDLLRAVVGLIEQSEEHASHLQSPPLRSLAEHYLRAIAVHLTERGDVLISEPDARSVCHGVSDALRNSGQVAVGPEPAEILTALTSHHVLERIDYPATSFRFEHQQFQEYYSALMLRGEIRRTRASGDSEGTAAIARKYVNDPSWEEPLRMIVANSGDTGIDLAAGKVLIQLALRVDAVFAARLSYLGGTALWKEVGAEIQDRLRTLHGAAHHRLREYALAAMLATGSDEFADIVVPLLTSPDQQIRLGTYRSGVSFHPSSLGADWQQVVAGWTEDQRAEFASELTIHQGMIEVGLFFARSDPSLSVRVAALQGLIWIGQRDTVAEILESFGDQEFTLAIQKFHFEEIPSTLYPRAIAAYRSLFDRTTDRKVRFQIAVVLAELNDPDTCARLKAEMEELSPDLVKELSDYTLRPAIELLRAADPQWLSGWVTDHILRGALWREDWLSLIIDVPQSLKEQLLHRAATEDLRRAGGGGGIMVLRATADAKTAKAIFITYRDHHRALLEDPQNQEKQSIDGQLRGLLRSLAGAVLIDGLSDVLARPPESEDLAVITELFGSRGAPEEDRDVLPEQQRKQLRDYLESAVRFMLGQDDFSGQGKGYLSSALSKVGDPCDISAVLQMIHSDINRMREGRAERARDHRTPKARASSSSWTPWHVDALLRLGHMESEPVLLDLLSEPEYEVDAAWALEVLARKTSPGPNPIMGARFGHPIRDFRKLSASASEWRAIYFEDRRLKYTEALRQRISNLLEESLTGDHRVVAYHHRLKELAKVLAALDPHDSAELITKIAELPARSDGWLRLALLEALVFAGVLLEADRMLVIIEPELAEFRRHGISNNNVNLLTRLLSLLPFVDEPKRGIGRMRDLLAEFRLSWYGNRDLLFALAQCPDDAGLELLSEVAAIDNNAFQHIAKDWLEALASCPLPGARTMLVRFVEPAADVGIAAPSLPDYAIDFLSGCLAKLGRRDDSFAQRFMKLTELPVSPQQRTILGKVLAWLGSPASLVAGLNLIDDASPQPIPYEVYRAIEDLFLEKRQYGNSQSYTLVPREANDLKVRLFEMARHDLRRTKSAYGLLAQIEEWRLEYGRPPSEPRHPAIESGELWPPIGPA